MFKILLEIPEGWGVNYVLQKWKFRGGWGVHTKFPPWWGYGYFLEPHNAAIRDGLIEGETYDELGFYANDLFAFPSSDQTTNLFLDNFKTYKGSSKMLLLDAYRIYHL